jgi:dTMP kinase
MRFVVIEGLDGSGKSTQLELLKAHLERCGIPYKYIHFPRLEEGYYGKLIARFLRGEMGSNDQVDPYLVALLFAGDRGDAAASINEWINDGYMVLADRYVYSNIAFQCAKIEDPEARETLMRWILGFEYDYQQLPRPDINLFLDAPFEFIRNQLMAERGGDDRAYLKGEKDIHEDNLHFQERVREVYLMLSSKVDDLILVECVDRGGNMLPPGIISEKVITLIQPQV